MAKKFIILVFLLITGCGRKVPITPYVPKETGVIQGLVYESDGKTPISGVMVWAYDTYGFVTGYAQTDIHGKYIIRDIPPGDYILQILSGEHYGTAGRYAGEYYKNAYEWELAAVVKVRVGETASGINFLLEKGGAFRGRLVDKLQKPIPKTPFFLKAYKHKNSYSTYFSITDSLGEYLVTGLEPGKYKIKIEPTGWVGGFYLGNSFETAASIESRFDTVSLVEFETERGGAISGKVTPYSSGVAIQVIGKEKALEKPPDSTGYYIIDGLPEDSYLVKLSPQKDSPFIWKYYPEAITTSQSTFISVTPPDTIRGVDFTLTQGGTISGEVKDEAGNPVEDFKFELYSLGGEELTDGWSFHSPTGKYEINGLPGGEYILKITSFSARTRKSYTAKYYKDGAEFKSATPIKVRSGYNTSGINFKLTCAGWVEGFIFLNNEVISSEDIKFKVIAIPVKGGPVIEGRHTFCGGYRITGLKPGEYKICTLAQNSDFSCIWFGGGRSFQDTKTSVIKIEKTKPTELNLSVSPGVCTIYGKVYDELTQLPISGEVAAYDSTGYVVQLATSDTAGYKLTGLVAGQYFLRTYKFIGYKDEWYKGVALPTPDCIDTTPWVVAVPSNASPIEVKEDAPTAEINLYLTP